MTNEIELRIAERVAFAGDHAFGDTGAYERISGRAHFCGRSASLGERDGRGSGQGADG